MRHQLTRAGLVLPLATLLALVGCDNGGDPDAGGVDAGSFDGGRDAGPPRPDAGGRDSGPTDSCASDDATATVGCNGAILGAQADDAFGGRCTPGDDTNPAGSCTNTDGYCWDADPDGNTSSIGICVVFCTPNGTTYVNTSDCPSGSRCFDFGDGVGLCFPDCNAGTDCSTMQCDEDNSCVGEMGTPAPDGGVPDGGLTDGGVVTDGGVAMDGGSAPTDGGAAPSDAGVDAGT